MSGGGHELQSHWKALFMHVVLLVSQKLGSWTEQTPAPPPPPSAKTVIHERDTRPYAIPLYAL